MWLLAAGSAILLVLAPVEVRQAIADFLWRDPLARVLLEVALIAVLAVLFFRWQVMSQLKRAAGWLQARRLGTDAGAPLVVGRFFRPLYQEVIHLVSSLESARKTAEEEARLRDAASFQWTAERLRAHVRARLDGRPLVVVSNREPYIHVRRNKAIELVVPASGLVTALEPVLRACAGTWVAHGSGDADRERVDARDRLGVPPDHPEYTLRRVWLTAEEEAGYYYGFSNEGMWPLCHIAHTRPLFRGTDWACYRDANRKFAEAVLEEIEGTPGRDGPGAGLSLRVAAAPDQERAARRARRRVLAHSVAESRGVRHLPVAGGGARRPAGRRSRRLPHAGPLQQLPRDRRTTRSSRRSTGSTSRRAGTATSPTSGRFRSVSRRPDSSRAPSADVRATLLREHGVSAEVLGVGVDRVDYTKGLIERLHGLERFFEKWQHYVGRFTFVQIGAPSRIRIKRYQDLLDEITAEADRINARFATSGWKPIVLLTRHHSHEEIAPYYRAADVCLVTALHDGMNLVAKEFVTAQEDGGDGVLILSQFAGASRELRDALIVNPYDIEQLADAIRRAIEMDPDERRARLSRMRRTVLENNVYRWAATLIGALADLRLEPAAPVRLDNRLAPGRMPAVDQPSRRRAAG